MIETRSIIKGGESARHLLTRVNLVLELVRVFFSDVCVVSITRNDRRWFVHSFFFFANSKNVTIAATAAMFEITIFVVVVPPPTHTGVYSGGDRMGGK